MKFWFASSFTRSLACSHTLLQACRRFDLEGIIQDMLTCCREAIAAAQARQDIYLEEAASQVFDLMTIGMDETECVTCSTFVSKIAFASFVSSADTAARHLHLMLLVCRSPTASCIAPLVHVAAKLRSLQPNTCNTHHTSTATVLTQNNFLCKC